MKEKPSCSICHDIQKDDVVVPDKMSAGELPVKNNPGDYSIRKNKTWCSYMENGFRETRDLMNEQVTPDCNRQKDSGK